MNILITQKIPFQAKKIFAEAGFTVTGGSSEARMTKAELITEGKTCSGAITLLSDQIDREVIENWKACKVIANYAVGYNNIDTAAASEHGIVVTNTPDILTNATADLTIGLLLSLARHIPAGDRFMREDKFTGWGPMLFLGTELHGKTIGIAGAGRIGQATGVRAKAFGCRIIYYNRSRKPAFETLTGAEPRSLEQLFSEADIVSVHLPLQPQTRHLISAKVLDLLRPEALFINTARGEVVDEAALIERLRRKRIRGAAFDVYYGEPDWNRELARLENVVLAPHTGSATYEARSGMAELAAKNIVAVLKGEPPLTPI